MKLVTAPMAVEYAGGATIPANERFVLPEGAVPGLTRALRDHGKHPRVSALGHYLRPYHGQDLTGKRLFAWRGFGIGDQLVFGGLLRILKARWPEAQIDFCVWPPLFRHLWEGAEGLPFNVVQEPLSFAAWSSYDYHLHGEGLCEADREPDQPDIWTGHLLFAGLDPDTVEMAERIPVVPLRASDISAAHMFVGKVASWELTDPDHGQRQPVVLWQLGSSTPIRSYRPDLTETAIRLLRERLPEALIVVTGHPQHFEEYTVPDIPGVTTTEGLTLRTVMALCKLVDVVVSPDSCLGHVCAAFDTPCVSLWSSFLPTDRVGSYRSHRPLVGQIECSPCRHHEQSMTPAGCPRTYEDETACRYCEGLSRIAPETIVDAVIKEI